jgi:hypothetical protein
MTIVLQNQFWDLKVEQDFFEIALSFNRNKEHLSVPFEALLGFFDPSVDFGLHFNSEIDATLEIAEAKEVEEVAVTSADNTEDKNDEKGNIVTLDTFRNKK